MTEAPERTLEERVAAIEQAIAIPSLDFPGQWTEEQVAEFRDKWEHLSAQPGVRWLPRAPVLTEETATTLLRECFTVVRPGEVLVIRAPADWTPNQADLYQEYASALAAPHGFGVLVYLGDQFARITSDPEPADPFADKAAQRGG